MANVASRIEAKVDRTTEHHLWTGAKKADGTGLIKVDGRLVTVRRVVWEQAHGDLADGVKVMSCSEDPACVRLEHLSVTPEKLGKSRSTKLRSAHGNGSKQEIRPGVWKLTVSSGRHDDEKLRRFYKTVDAANAKEAAVELSTFVAEVRNSGASAPKSLRDLTVDEAIERFLVEHLAEEKGREQQTISDYRCLHGVWFSPVFGDRKVRHIDEAMIDKAFGRMRRAGLSRSRMNQAKSLYAPFFRWAKRRRIITRSPMADFELPTSTQVSKERLPPEVEELAILLSKTLEIVPDIAPILILGAVTGMRRGELVGLRRSRVAWDELRLTVDTAIDPESRRLTVHIAGRRSAVLQLSK